MKTRFINILNTLKLLSNDIHTRTSAIIVDDFDEIISVGWNTMPVGIDNNETRFERPEKYYWFIHAEVNAIIRAAKHGIKTDNTTMYMSCGVPCTDCAKAIIGAGIRKIIYTDGGGSNQDKWKEHFIRSLKMFEEAGIEVVSF